MGKGEYFVSNPLSIDSVSSATVSPLLTVRKIGEPTVRAKIHRGLEIPQPVTVCLETFDLLSIRKRDLFYIGVGEQMIRSLQDTVGTQGKLCLYYSHVSTCQVDSETLNSKIQKPIIQKIRVMGKCENFTYRS